MIAPLSRRRFLTIAACGLALPGSVGAATASWRGVALGAQASITLGGLGGAAAAPTLAAVEAEIQRLEDVFSLYRPASAISRLNRDGGLDRPPADLLAVLRLCDEVHAATGGTFDPTIQPLWLAFAGTGNLGPAQARRLVGWQGVRMTPERIAFAHPGMAITLNGVAQGYITDRVAGLLRDAGFTDVLVDMGEIAALGRHGGAGWRADIAGPDGRVVRRLTLADRCLAVSATRGSVIGATGASHILDPRTGRPALPPRLAAVSAGNAAVADALSTACCLLPADPARDAVARFPGAKLETRI